VLLVLVALGVAGTVWLVWSSARDVESSTTPAVAQGPDASVPDAAASERGPTAPPDPLLEHLERWACSPRELARLREASGPSASGYSPFERRLWIGGPLAHLAADLDAGALPIQEAQVLFAVLVDVGVLRLERSGRVLLAATWREDHSVARLERALDELVRPSRARDAFVLHGREADPLATGRDLRLRVWTPHGVSVAPARVEEALSLLRRLDAVTAVAPQGSVDVLATPKGGRDVLPPLSRLPIRFAGVYLHRDRLAVVDTSYPSDFFRRLLHHEVTHAWHRAVLPRWEARFATEGLATFVSWLEEQDVGLAVPSARLEDDFAWLLDTLEDLERLGLRLPPTLGFLVRLRPWEFYSLGWFSYALAEACFAYVGEDAVVAALRRGDPEALLAHFEAIEWAELRAWMRDNARHGRASRALFVTESPVPGEDDAADVELDTALLARLGIEAPAERIDEVAASLRGGLRTGSPGGEERPPRDPGADEAEAGRGTYVGVSTCKKCHFVQYRSWQRLAHARALEVLAPGEAVEAKRAAGLDPDRDYRSGGACFRCHTTGYGTPTGYPVPRTGVEPTDELKRRMKEHGGVGCEACHGPGSAYVPYKQEHEDYRWKEIAVRGALVPILEAHCTGCHTPGCPTMAEDYTFDFDAARRSDRIHDHVPLRVFHGDRGR